MIDRPRHPLKQFWSRVFTVEIEDSRYSTHYVVTEDDLIAQQAVAIGVDYIGEER
jgi:hypothetical protein